jgi:hypothetical protein
MEELEHMIRDAEIMLRSADPAQRERGRERLREVMSEAEGSVYAKQAQDLLAAAGRPGPEPVDPELDKLMGLWPSIQGFGDYRLAPFLKQLESYPGVAVPLRTDVIGELRGWIAEALPRVGAGAPPTQIAALHEFVAAVRGVAAYEELPEFGQLRDGLFHLRLQETAARVDEALKVWALDEAQRLLDELGLLPDVFKEQVERLQEEVYEVERLRRAAQALLRQLPAAALSNWSEARSQAELLQQLRQYLSDPRVPQARRSELEEAHARLAASVEQFVRVQALAAVTIPKLREFWAEFGRLPADIAGRWQLGEDWFPRGLEALAAETGRKVERAPQPDELTAVANRLREDSEGVPPSVAARMTEMADAVGRSAAAWKAMRDGQVFELPTAGPGALPVPAAWRAEAARYGEWLRQIDAALGNFRGETPPASEQDYRDGLRLAEEILARAPDHILARKLRLESTRRISCYQLDRALASWSLESFFELFKANNPGEVYSALAGNKEALAELRALTRQGPVANWSAAAQWSSAWRAAIKRLPSAKPDALLRALAQEVTKRQQEWYGALDRLLKDNLSPQEYEAAAASLDSEADTNLQTYQQELRRKATIGRIEQLIKSARLEEAEQELGKLPPGSTDAVRLQTQLTIAQARGRGSAAVAELLSGEWNNVQRYVEQPRRVLLETIYAVWSEGRQEWVDKLAQLLSRVLAREEKEDGAARELAEWESWLEIEEGLLRNFTSSGVRQLADYLRGVEPGALLDRRLRKILEHWQAEENTVMLAWAYQAFQRKSSVAESCANAADDLVRESDHVAEHVLGALAGSPALELEDLKPLQESLQREEERWQTLDDFLSLYLPHPVEHPQLSPTFARAKSSVGELARVLTLLAQLKEEDLRQDAARQDFDDAYARARRLNGVAARARLLEDLERLRPLRKLFSVEQRIRETAERCRSKDALEVLEPNLFARLAGYVRQVAATFVSAEAVDRAMWELVSAEYEGLIYREAGVLLPPSGLPRLDKLAETLEALHDEEAEFTQALALLEDRDRQPTVPWGGAFDPEPHLDYLRLIPATAPRSLKVYHRFDRARRDTLKLILEAHESRPHLPVWVREYLEQGVPACANEH